MRYLYYKIYEKDLIHRISETKRKVVNISSGAAVNPYCGWSLYCAAKAGVEAFTAWFALEQLQAKYPAMIYAIRPGVIDTEMQQQIRAQDETRFAEIEKFKALKRDGQLATADETAAKIAAIIADSAPTGGIYDVRTHRYNE